MFNWLKKNTTSSAPAQAGSTQPDDRLACKEKGDSLLDAGKFAEAAEAYRQAIALDPSYAEAYNNLANALRESGQPDEAENSLRKAISIKPELAFAHYNLGSLLQAQGRLTEAIDHFSIALELRPEVEDFYVDAFRALLQAGQIQEAKAVISKGLALNPDFPEFHFLLAALYEQTRELDKAIDCYKRGLNLQPDSAAAYSSLGRLLNEQNNYAEATTCYLTLSKIAPQNVEALYSLGVLFQKMGALEKARDYYLKALEINPDLFAAHYNLGVLARMLGNETASIVHYRKAIEINPEFAQAYCNLANILFEQGNSIDASVSYRKAIRINPDFANACYGLAVVLVAQQAPLEAIFFLRRTLELEPDHFAARALLIYQLLQQCEWENLDGEIELVRKSASNASTSKTNALPPLVFLAIPNTTASEQKLCAERWIHSDAENIAILRDSLKFSFETRSAREKLNIGYISADFRQHPVSFLMAEVFELHDRDRFQVSAYSYGPEDGSAMHHRVRNAFDCFVDIQNISNVEAAQRIYDDRVDILVDLTGHTQGSRSAILALKPAPIQVNYLGYPGTMGADYVDYMIADQFTIPQEQRQHYTEKVFWMPDCFQANDRKRPRPVPPTREECGLPAQGIVFCCFNQTLKITPEIFDVWCRLLKALPDSVLWLPAGNSHVEANLRREATKRGVAPERLRMAPFMEREPHLARLQCADLFLDTLPFNAGTTCSDALWMGLPVVTCAGDAFASRMAGSLLNAIGAPELITYNLDDYFQLALELASSPDKLAAIRSKIIANRDIAPLFDSTRFTRNLEQAFIQMMSA